MWCSCGWNCERRRERMMSEATDQMALIEFAARFAERVPELARLVHVPNGEHRAKGTAGRLKAMGVRAGLALSRSSLLVLFLVFCIVVSDCKMGVSICEMDVSSCKMDFSN